MLFDPANRSELIDVLEYERYILKKSIRIQEMKLGKASPLTITVSDNPPHEGSIKFTESLTSVAESEVIKSLSPLIFVSAFKICDMIIEWVLNENGKKPKGHFWNFMTKISAIQDHSIIFPDFLQTEPLFNKVLISIFIYFRPRRNAIVHGGWGKQVDGDLHFNFKYEDQLSSPKSTVNEKLRHDDILTFADYAVKLSDLLITPSSKNTITIDAIKYLSDRLKHFHKENEFGITLPRYFNVVRKTVKEEIDIDEILKILKIQTLEAPFSFHLTIIKNLSVNNANFSPANNSCGQV
ncbi:MAG: hypothetical protein HZA47_11685 [Planctomycetes bacterium]|uniref:hypothetical protein n=1 Tax=Candidatus Wunengus sp. YC65 TaxID=3367701 RepID=UPI001DF5AE2F|nr:hypothetical protein [Planctomycetota bacterium]